MDTQGNASTHKDTQGRTGHENTLVNTVHLAVHANDTTNTFTYTAAHKFMALARLHVAHDARPQ